MRVVAGTLRGRTILAPPGQATRPTTDRTREAIFNALVSLGAVDGATAADLFAGSGALGIEALSRGAANCTFVESDPAALEAIRANVRSLGLDSRSRISASRVENAVSGLNQVDLVLVDPPYGYDGWRDLLARLEAAVPPGGIAVLESGSDLEGSLAAAAGWEILRVKKYGRTWVTFLERV